MAEYLTAELAKVGVDDEAIVEYCAGLLGDASMAAEEKHEAIVGYLEAVTEAETGEIVHNAIARMAEEQAQHRAEDEQRAKDELDRAQERERAEFRRDMEAATREERQLTAEERKQREAFLKKYGYNALEVVEKNGEAEIVYREAKDTPAKSEGNDNAKVVADRQRTFRENAKAAHQKKVERDKEMLEKERLKKDKEKRRTMKNEKRRM